MTDNNSLHNTNIKPDVLRWYMDMGVDEALENDPVDWFQQAEIHKQNALKPASKANEPPVTSILSRGQNPKKTPSRNFPSLPPDGAVNEAREKARNAKTLEELETLLRNFDGCGLKATAKNTCIQRGNPESDLMLIGEAPGRDEDIQGMPFVGRAGQLLDKMLAAIDRSEKNTYITNIVYWRPPGNRTPTPQEAQICLPFLERQIELINPKVIVLLGGAAAKHMLKTNEGIMRLRGKWKTVEVGGNKYKAIATLHPAYLLRTPAGKKLAWNDFLAIKKALESAT